MALDIGRIESGAAVRPNLSRRRFFRRAGLFCLSMPITGLWSSALAETPNFPVFGHIGTPLNSFSETQKWVQVLRRFREEEPLMRVPCNDANQDTCRLFDWNQFLESIRGHSEAQKIARVNDVMNSVNYIEDMQNYGILDYWATPLEFFYRSGDCEDYVITKYLSLKELGVPAGRMRVTVLQDENLGVNHAVLLVLSNDAVLMLDNQIDELIEASAVEHYTPFYSVNDENVWIHF